MSRALFVTGTGTDVGKTYVAGLIAKKLVQSGKSVGYYKAAMSGNLRRKDGSLIPGDALYVQKTAGLSQPLEEMCPFVYEHAWSPHLAADAEGSWVDLETVTKGFRMVCERHDDVVVEGSGGIICPLRLDGSPLWLEDVIKSLKLSSVIVSSAGLGAINGVVLTAEYMKTKGLPVKGLIFNHFRPGEAVDEDNIRVCEHRTGLPVLALVKEGDTDLDISPSALCALFS